MIVFAGIETMLDLTKPMQFRNGNARVSFVRKVDNPPSPRHTHIFILHYPEGDQVRLRAGDGLMLKDSFESPADIINVPPRTHNIKVRLHIQKNGLATWANHCDGNHKPFQDLFACIKIDRIVTEGEGL